jgi:6-phosphofructokinase 1
VAKLDFTIDSLGENTHASPIRLSKEEGDYRADYVCESHRVIYGIEGDMHSLSQGADPKEMLEIAGPRETIAFDPAEVHAAIVTCGGLCPGLNDVIRALVMCLRYHYGVKHIKGVRYGYRGFLPECGFDPIELTPDLVGDIHRKGGSLLGSSRGYGDRTCDIADALERQGINMVFAIGGDGTQKGALDLSEEVKRRDHRTVVVGIPKTIDNDLSFVQRSFGFETSVSMAVHAVQGAHVEARGAINGIGIVKVMGRQSGFIAAHTALAMNDVNFVLIPEVPFDLSGDNGLLRHLEKRLLRRHHAVILVAEGAGQDLLQDAKAKDKSGNKKLADVGPYLKQAVGDYFKQQNTEVNIKYIDPSYIIRSAPANANDSIYCARLGGNAVHAAMSGRTGLIISLLHDRFVHVPMRLAVTTRNCVDPEGRLWRDVVEATGQAQLMKNPG